jgi:hypothetical protein
MQCIFIKMDVFSNRKFPILRCYIFGIRIHPVALSRIDAFRRDNPASLAGIRSIVCHTAGLIGISAGYRRLLDQRAVAAQVLQLCHFRLAGRPPQRLGGLMLHAPLLNYVTATTKSLGGTAARFASFVQSSQAAAWERALETMQAGSSAAVFPAISKRPQHIGSRARPTPISDRRRQ